MNEIPIIKYLPEKYQGFTLAFIAAMIWASPYLTRAFHALKTGGGLTNIASIYTTNTIYGINAASLAALNVLGITATTNSVITTVTP
jgi:hypothetical protein